MSSFYSSLPLNYGLTMKTYEVETLSSNLVPILSLAVFLPLMPIKAKLYLYFNFVISSEPKLINQSLALSESDVTQSSIQAATTMYPLGKTE